MRLLFASCHEYLPDRVGGLELSTHELCESLGAAGAGVGVLAGFRRRGWRRARARFAGWLWGRHALREEGLLAYPVFRARDPAAAVPEVLARFQPDAVIADPDRALLEALATARQPTLVYFRDAVFRDTGSALPAANGVGYVANSGFVREAVRRTYGVEPVVIPPLVKRERYETRVAGIEVLFVNPVPEKGVDLAFAIAARCPSRRFRFVECWPLGPDQRAQLRRRAGEAGNVQLQGPTRDMRGVYASARVLIVPSRWQEAWGRVVTEGQLSGIPVLATRVGGLPESVGQGGLLFDPEADASAWASAIERLFTDDEHHGALGRQARERAVAQDLAPGTLIPALLGAARSVAASATA